jgi:CDP-paratose 2-epimerase
LSIVRILITGICGFVGSSIAKALIEHTSEMSVLGLDNFIRPGSESNRLKLKNLGVSVLHGDVRLVSDFETLPPVDWIIDAAANPNVLAGIDGRCSSRQLLEHNLIGTTNVLEYCKATKAGLILLSTSRVYSISALAGLPLIVREKRFALDSTVPLPLGVSCAGIDETFSTGAPISLYGSTKLASEILALEYATAFSFPVWINRCGVLAGAGQMGTAEQGIFSYWLHAYARRRPLRYLGFDGRGCQLRDAFHPHDLASLLLRQMAEPNRPGPHLFTVGGGAENAMSLAELSAWCEHRFGRHKVQAELRTRPFDVPWLVMDSTRVAGCFGWHPQRTIASILEEIAAHVEQNPDWLERTALS